MLCLFNLPHFIPPDSHSCSTTVSLSLSLSLSPTVYICKPRGLLRATHLSTRVHVLIYTLESNLYFYQLITYKYFCAFEIFSSNWHAPLMAKCKVCGIILAVDTSVWNAGVKVC